MSVRTIVNEPGIYFMTFTCHKWLSLIEATKSYDQFNKFFTVLKEKEHHITGYVLMPNHVHLLLYFAGGKINLNTILGNGKRFIAYEIVKRLQRSGKIELLKFLEAAVGIKDASRGKKHEVWQPGFEVKPCRTEKFLLLKLNYIHDNPVAGKWKLADSRESYLHSSARFYLRNVQQLWEVVHYEKLIDWENMYANH